MGGTISQPANQSESGPVPNPDFLPWETHVRFRRVQTLVRDGSSLVKLHNSA